ncbi:MAG: hypothetical protein JNJ98_14325 [Gemmatimonadetes bacterium]|nr:hypothetical protein [Gemmatimonadota bacterium]
MRGVCLCALALASAGPLGAQVVAPGKAGTAPAWVGRLDPAAEKRGAKLTENTLVETSDGLRLTTSVPAIYWLPAQAAAGAYTVKASFAQVRASVAEAYGVFLGGTQLQKGPQNYLYCVVAGNGTYAVRHVNGTEVNELAGRTAHPAVRKTNADGQVTNEVAVRVSPDRTSCLVNGTEVWGYATRALVGPGKLQSTDGAVGIRVNQGLDVRVSGFSVTKG